MEKPSMTQAERTITPEKKNEQIDIFLDEEVGILESLGKKSKKLAHILAFTSFIAVAACDQKTEADTPNSSTTTNESVSNLERSSGRAKIRLAERRVEHQKMAEIINRAAELADTMNIEFDPNQHTLYTEWHVVTKINGQQIPLSLLTDKERANVAQARRLGGMMGGTVNDADISAEKRKPGEVIESMPIDTSIY